MATPASISENGAGDVSLLVAPYNYSPYAWRVQLALVEKGIPFTAVPVNIWWNKPKELLEANPIYGKIPVLLHNGNSICESTIILEYLEEAWPEKKPLMPKDAVAKTKVRFWTDHINKGFEMITEIIRMQLGGPAGSGSGEATAAAKVPKFFETMEAAMLEYSADGPFFTGDEFGYLDVVLAPLSHWRKVLELVVKSPLPGPDQLPRVHKWMKAMNGRKSVEDNFATDDEIYDFFANRLKSIALQVQYHRSLKAGAAQQK